MVGDSRKAGSIVLMIASSTWKGEGIKPSRGSPRTRGTDERAAKPPKGVAASTLILEITLLRHADGMFLLIVWFLRDGSPSPSSRVYCLLVDLTTGSRTHHVALLRHPFGIEQTTTGQSVGEFEINEKSGLSNCRCVRKCSRALFRTSGIHFGGRARKLINVVFRRGSS